VPGVKIKAYYLFDVDAVTLLAFSGRPCQRGSAVNGGVKRLRWRNK
jgi:hypothetical protein